MNLERCSICRANMLQNISGKGGHLFLIKCHELTNWRTTLRVRRTKSGVVSKGPYKTRKPKALVGPNIVYTNEVSTLKLRPPSENIEDIEDGELRNAACIMRLGGRGGPGVRSSLWRPGRATLCYDGRSCTVLELVC